MKNRILAALLAFFVGWLGIHKFYLGYNLAGIVYLIFSWTFIPGLIAFFEGVGLLLMSDRAFDAQYNGVKLIEAKQESSREKTATLKDLKSLYDSGIITAEEYEEKRRKILDSI